MDACVDYDERSEGDDERSDTEPGLAGRVRERDRANESEGTKRGNEASVANHARLRLQSFSVRFARSERCFVFLSRSVC
jgi:hypothetical protein